MTMHTVTQLQKKLPAFREFLAARGAEVLEPTNEFEVVRFRAGAQTGVVYRKASGQLTYQGIASDALNAFVSKGNWSAGVKTPRKARSNPVIQRLLSRDGDRCFLCRQPLGADITEEHLVPLAAGGPNHIANKALAHAKCNLRMGHLSLMEKIALREQSAHGDGNEVW